MTSGYHQASISADSQRFTAFITFMGIFSWLRVPMGLKGAPPYFQHGLATVVLAGLLYIILELYLDDSLLYAKTEAELLKNLRTLFTRFRTHNITLNPDKCELGSQEIEFLGHQISATGISFCDDKLDGIRNFPTPKTAGDLKSFLGLANYFRDHIHNHSMIVEPLQRMIDGYSKKARSQKLDWTPTNVKAFEDIKNAISNCQKLYYVDPNARLHLHTDASDYGIGAYLFQIVDGVKYPIRFISKSLNKTQLNWSVPEKEMYAIVFALDKLQHLLRDTDFTLWTYHENLTRTYSTGSQKVLRWKLRIMEYSFDIHHIEGKLNIVADPFSRLCARNDSSVTGVSEVLAALCFISDPTEYLTALEEDMTAEIYFPELSSPQALTAHEMFAPLIENKRIPDSIYSIISRYHNSIVDHSGRDRTLRKILRNATEAPPNIRAWVDKFIKQCPCCQKMSQLRIPIHTTPYSTATYRPMQRINIDTMGPFPVDEDGNAHILVIIDTFTRWKELYAIKTTDAMSAFQSLLAYVGRYGCPQEILSDNGSQFVNSLITELVKVLGTEQITTIAYSKEENAMVERANKEVLRHLTAMVFDKLIERKWSKYLPLIQRILNSEVHENIGVSPADLLYGNAINLDRGILLPFSTNYTNVELSKYTSDHLLAQNKLILISTERQKARDQVHFNSRSLLPPTEFPINSFVLVSYPETRMGSRPPTKLHLNLKGPMRVVSFTGSNYKLLNLSNDSYEQVHIKRLKPFVFDPSRDNPTKISHRDTFEYIVEQILQHHGDPKLKSGMDFLVRWKNLDPSADLWLPWKELRNNPALHAYLRTHHMVKLIPKEFIT